MPPSFPFSRENETPKRGYHPYTDDMRTRELVFFLCAVSFFFASIPGFSQSQSSPGQQQQVESHQKQARAYLNVNRIDLAATEFRAIVALEPNNTDAQGNLG